MSDRPTIYLSFVFSYTSWHIASNIFVFINIVGSQNRSFIINKIVGSSFVSRFLGVQFQAENLAEAGAESEPLAAAGSPRRAQTGSNAETVSSLVVSSAGVA